MPKKSFDQRLKERWRGKQSEKAAQKMANMQKWDKEFRQMGRIIPIFRRGGDK